MPGTVGTYDNIVVKDSKDNTTVQTKIIVEKGPQTIVCPDQPVQMGNALTLTPHSIDGNSAQISCASPHLPTYTFASVNPTIATVNAAGVVTPVSPGTVTITISSAATNSYTAAADKSVTITVEPPPTPPAITSASPLPNGTVNAAYGHTFTATGSTPITFTDNGALPPGLSLSTIGVLSGTPTSIGTFTFDITATNVAAADTKTFSLTITDAPAPPVNPPNPYLPPTSWVYSGGDWVLKPSPEPRGEPATIGHCKEWVSIYERANTKSKILGRAYLGDVIHLVRWNADESWCYVFYNDDNNVGWVQGKYIIPED